ncbi:uncharacterized protein LOC113512895 [Galleria mellonella]|uniref:Uncharacterized protein LOC113512895 n=1 Tax=Galleria mellonella TaxID=7137 RepID=A0A6J1WMG2_GALME|nr:uncharacterized protein LOC113512895 [Galleria mellonella]
MLRILITIGFLKIAYAATGLTDLPQKPAEFAHIEGCYIKEINDVVRVSTYLTPIGSCVRIGCLINNLDYATCPVVFTEDPKCHVTESDTSKSYPHCCPNIKCDEDNKL